MAGDSAQPRVPFFRDNSFDCGCYMKVYVCPKHLEVAAEELQGLTSQLQLRILDTEVSVSATEDGGR